MLEPAQREKEELLARLRRVEGQLRGIQRMIAEDQDCEAVITQLMAARGALDKASLLIVSRQLERCLLDPQRSTSREQLQRIVEFMLRFAPVNMNEEA
jgi:CsoR family transcriptional regulator, copper-sensing transcriptional repressor